MANQEHLDILKQGLAMWTWWRQQHPGIQPDLSFANLYGTDLHAVDLSGANLRGANFISAFLYEANLVGADLREASLSQANLSGANFSRADLSGANLGGAVLVQTKLTGATLTQCSIYGIAAWDVELEGAKQENLVITPLGEPTITVDDLEVAQLIYLLLNHKKLRNVLNAVTERGVLLLGRFGGGGLEVLQAVAARLREERYLPIIFDFERPDDRNYTETVKTLAGLSRFIIADLSGPSVPKELEATVPDYKIPFAFICQADAKPFSMSIDLFGYPWVLRPALLFTTVEDLLAKLQIRVIEPAEEMAEKTRRAKEKTLEELFSNE